MTDKPLPRDMESDKRLCEAAIDAPPSRPRPIYWAFGVLLLAYVGLFGSTYWQGRRISAQHEAVIKVLDAQIRQQETNRQLAEVQNDLTAALVKQAKVQEQQAGVQGQITEIQVKQAGHIGMLLVEKLAGSRKPIPAATRQVLIDLIRRRASSPAEAERLIGELPPGEKDQP